MYNEEKKTTLFQSLKYLAAQTLIPHLWDK